MPDDSPDPHLVRRAEAGDPEAQTDLGVFYFERIPERGAAETAEMWLGRAAAQNHPNAKHNLGVLFHQLSDQHEQNWDRALNWFWQAAQDGFLPSIYIVANVLWNAGKRDQALVLFDKAARQGHPESQGAARARPPHARDGGRISTGALLGGAGGAAQRCKCPDGAGTNLS